MSRDDLEHAIFDELVSEEIRTLPDQRELCSRIADLFPPPYLTRYALTGIVEQLESCGYECEGGPLENNTAFLALKELVAV